QLRLQSMPSVPRQVWLAVAAIGIAVAVWAWWRRSRTPGRGPWLTITVGMVFAAAGLVCAVTTPTFALPSQVWLCLPYVASLVALAAAARSGTDGARAPAM